jgi:hypothetical protein
MILNKAQCCPWKPYDVLEMGSYLVWSLLVVEP